MDVCLLVKQRLEELGFEQKDLASGAEVTESYISQLLTRKKLPRAPDRTDIYEKMAKFLFLKLSSDRLSKLADLQHGGGKGAANVVPLYGQPGNLLDPRDAVMCPLVKHNVLSRRRTQLAL